MKTVHSVHWDTVANMVGNGVAWHPGMSWTTTKEVMAYLGVTAEELEARRANNWKKFLAATDPEAIYMFIVTKDQQVTFAAELISCDPVIRKVYPGIYNKNYPRSGERLLMYIVQFKRKEN